jgi:selenocysteine lyase/cysteine desulfurase
MTSLSRRELFKGIGGVAATAAASRLEALPPAASSQAVPGFPRKADFNITSGLTYLNGAFTHPIPRVALDAARRNAELRATPGAATWDAGADPRVLFAQLINARPTEIAFVPNTSTGENIVVDALGIGRFDGNVVTDALHFDGALVHLMELQRRGLDLRIVKPKDFRIDIRDMERVVDAKTRLIEVSLVAMYNGFQHDLKAICDLAHAHGALVYADIVQAAGAVPIDVKASGVDFCACSSFKWLMGDFGIGFLYVREDLLGTRVRRSQWNYHSTSVMEGRFPPFEADGMPVTYTLRDDATGYFDVGSTAWGPVATLTASLGYINSIGVPAIQAWRQPLIRRLQAELPRLGFTPATPADSTSPIVTFATRDGAAVQRKLQTANINVRVAPLWVRLSPSVYNDMNDIERVLEALS